MNAMNQLASIALSGSAGAITRFLVANGIYALPGRRFPHGALFVNVSGCFLMGLLTELRLSPRRADARQGDPPCADGHVMDTRPQIGADQPLPRPNPFYAGYVPFDLAA